MPAQQRQQQYEEQQRQRQEQAYQAQQAKAQDDAARAKNLHAVMAKYPGQRPPGQEIIGAVGIENAKHVFDALDEVYPRAKAPEPFTLNPGDVRFDGNGKQLATVPKPEVVKEPKLHPITVAGPDGRPMSKMVSEEELAKGVPVYREPKAAPAEKAKFWVIRDGKQLRISENEYQPGDQPASTREQGRSVTSGDAGRIADFDTSMDDVDVLERDLGQTGAASKLGAMLPNVVTEVFGWGESAKQRQAVIDRVKQVIGKALEGGVLRKEDEAKYEKILPTIGDAPQVAKVKIAGLRSALIQRRQRFVDSLEDANYDVKGFNGDRAKPAQSGPDLSGLRPGAGRKFTDGPFKGQTWSVDADGKPYKVGG
jgi:hypothetical protein